MTKKYQYCVAENWGKGFIKNSDSRKILPKSFIGNVWRVNANNQDSNKWIIAVNGVNKTLVEAQAIVDEAVETAKLVWDNMPDAEKAPANQTVTRPTNITLEE